MRRAMMAMLGPVAVALPAPTIAQSAAVFRAEPDYSFSVETGDGAEDKAAALWAELRTRFADDPDLALAAEAQVAADRGDILAAMQAQSGAVVDCRQEARDDCAPLSLGSAVLGRFYRDNKDVLEFAALLSAGDEPSLEAAQAIAPVAMRLELTEKLENVRAASTLRERAVAIYEAEGGEVPWELIAAYFRLSDNYRSQRRYSEAEAALEKAAALADETWDFDAAAKGDLALQLAELYADMRRPAAAENQVARARAILAQWFEAYEQLPLEAEAAYARSLLGANRLDEAEPVFEAIERCLDARMGLPFEPVAVRLMLDRGELHERRGEPAAAEEIYRNIVTRAAAAKVEESPLVARALKRLAGTLQRQQRLDEAAQTFSRALAMLTATVGKAHPATADTLLEVGRVDEAGGRLARAREAYATALAYLAPFPVGLDHAVLQSRIAAVDAALDEKDASLTRFARAAEAFDEAIGASASPERAQALHEWGKALIRFRQPTAGHARMREARAMFAQVADETNLARIEALAGEAELLGSRDPGEAYGAIATATRGAVRRMESYEGFDRGAQAELARFAPVFARHVRIAWEVGNAR